jgi:hypothetical protein
MSQMILRKKYETLVTQRGGEILFLETKGFRAKFINLAFP